jgi:hypothetical protein
LAALKTDESLKAFRLLDFFHTLQDFKKLVIVFVQNQAIFQVGQEETVAA